MNKYRNIRSVCSSGHKHASKKEAAYCGQLKLRKQASDIVDYRVEVPFVLQESFRPYPGAKKIRAISYRADFVVLHHDGSREIIDVKGVQTAVFRIKWKLLHRVLMNKKQDYILSIV